MRGFQRSATSNEAGSICCCVSISMTSDLMRTKVAKESWKMCCVWLLGKWWVRIVNIRNRLETPHHIGDSSAPCMSEAAALERITRKISPQLADAIGQWFFLESTYLIVAPFSVSCLRKKCSAITLSSNTFRMRQGIQHYECHREITPYLEASRIQPWTNIQMQPFRANSRPHAIMRVKKWKMFRHGMR